MARVLGRELGYAVLAPKIAGFSGLETKVAGREENGPHINLSYMNGLPEKFDMRTLKAVVDGMDPRPTISLHSFFQHADNFAPHRKFLSKCIPFADINPKDESYYRHIMDTVDDTLVVHVRLGDYKTHGLVLDPNYYYRAARYFGFARIVILSDEPSDEYVRNLGAELMEVFDVPVEAMTTHWTTAFNIIRNAKKIVIANSTFSWLAAFLNLESHATMPWNYSKNWSDNAGGADLRFPTSQWAVLQNTRS